MTPSICSTCGCEIREGQGRYVTHDGVFCTSCGLPFPLGPGAKVTIVITDPEGKLDRYSKEAS
ncbi:MAG: hypothetical protein A4E60_01940 [Syntrophorhabdus sp. PtaB.Bin047]|jgi:hypothetical protein|nr:MAG: hypothetical protein A4E60_01940 [Syntrophorhabdus sp. PtaB.Bin047]